MGGGSGGRGVEGQIVANVFKTLVSRLVRFNKDLKTPENMVGVMKFKLFVISFIKFAPSSYF